MNQTEETFVFSSLKMLKHKDKPEESRQNWSVVQTNLRTLLQEIAFPVLPRAKALEPEVKADR
jgi:hypothetical protein